MKFDKVIMNPPYEKNLHLKILNNMLEQSDEVVNLSPIRWLQDPFKEYKQGTDYKRFPNIINHLKSLDVIDLTEAAKLFSGAEFTMDLGIYEISKSNKSYKDMFNNTLLQKVVPFCWNNRVPVDKNMKDGWRVKWTITSTRGSHGYEKRTQKGEFYLLNLKYFYEGMKDGKHWYEHFVKNQFTKTTPEITYSVKFESEVECINFCNSMKTDFCRFCQEIFIKSSIIQDYSIPYMENEINPRTGLKGYKSEWTDEDFYQFFNITEDELSIIRSSL